jgi:hypothetical protein
MKTVKELTNRIHYSLHLTKHKKNGVSGSWEHNSSGKALDYPVQGPRFQMLIPTKINKKYQGEISCIVSLFQLNKIRCCG